MERQNHIHSPEPDLSPARNDRPGRNRAAKTNLSQAAGTRILEFDGLRAIAILLLILHHGGVYNFSIGNYSLRPLQPYVPLFLLGSFLFLSGFLLARNLEKTSTWAFWSNRFWRLVVPYWISLALFILILQVTPDRLDLLIHLTGSQMVLSPRFTTPILTLWYVGLTLTYYLIFGVLLKWARKPQALLAAALVIFLAAALARMEYGLFARRFFYYFFVFAAGIVVAKMDWLEQLTTTRFWLLDKLLLLLGAWALLSPLESQIGKDVNPLLVLAITLFILAAILLTLSLLRWVMRGSLIANFFSILSSASFFAYLLHRPIWELLVGSGDSLPKSTLSLYLILIGLAVVIPVAYLIQNGYNRVLARLMAANPNSWRNLASK